MLKIDNLRSGWERAELGSGLSVELKVQDHLQLSGGSGSGKTSLMRVIAGLQPASEGSIEWQSLTLTCAQLGWWRQQIAYCPQHAVIGAETVAEALLLPWALKAITHEAPTPDQMQAAMQQLGLSLALDAKTERLSGGEQYRLMLARAGLLQRPIWLLDEPTAALDNHSSQRLADMLSQHQGIIISISHDPFWQQFATQRFTLDSADFANMSEGQ